MSQRVRPGVFGAVVALSVYLGLRARREGRRLASYLRVVVTPTVNRFKALLCLTLVLSGCTAYRHPASLKPPAFTADELADRLHLKVAVRMPSISELETVKNANVREVYYEMEVEHAHRLISILTDCQVVESVVAIDEADGPFDAIIVDLPMNVERTDMDDPMALMYGGVLPVYSKAERGIHFRFLKGGDGEFTFEWTESEVISLWAPVLTAGNSKWTTSGKSTAYWYDLRAELLRTFSTRHTTK
jgi:hypothetical protein